MAAGQGFKTFTTGEVLTAADVNGYLMQGVLVFASAAARDAAITSPQEGQFAYTKDNNSLWYYTGSAWAASGATGDIEGVTAGVGISGGGTSGTVTITNDMATTITASGDIVVGTGSGTYDNLPIGTTNQVLTADTTVSPYKVKWATPSSGGGYTQLATGSLSGSSVSITSISQDYKDLVIYLQNTALSTGAAVRFTLNNNTNSYYGYTFIQGGTTTGSGTSGLPYGYLGDFPGYQDSTSVTMTIPNYAYSNSRPHWQAFGGQYPSNAQAISIFTFGAINNGTAVSSIQLFPSTGTFSNGTYYLFGVK